MKFKEQLQFRNKLLIILVSIGIMAITTSNALAVSNNAANATCQINQYPIGVQAEIKNTCEKSKFDGIYYCGGSCYSPQAYTDPDSDSTTQHTDNPDS